MQWKGIHLELIFLWMSPYVWSDYHRGIGVPISTSTLLLLTPPLLAYWLNLWSQGPWSLVELRKQALTLTATGHPIHSYGSSKRIVWWFILKHWKTSRKSQRSLESPSLTKTPPGVPPSSATWTSAWPPRGIWTLHPVEFIFQTENLWVFHVLSYRSWKMSH